MKRTPLKKVTALFVALVLALQTVLPAAALAEQRTVEVSNLAPTSEQSQIITNIVIDEVEPPVSGTTLDNHATVTTLEDATWEIPVIWVRDDLQIDADEADEGHTYLPALAFFVPQGYVLESDAVTVTLSDSLVKLFGTQEIISVYDASKGITYIIPASLKDLFARDRGASERINTDELASATTQAQSASDASEANDESNDAPGWGGDKTIVDVYCAKTARDILSDEDLQWLIELVTDYLELQAVELLLTGFQNLREAATKGEIGKEISLYIYYLKGDKDGIREHESASNALAYVYGDVSKVNGELKYCYMIGMDVDDLIKKDENGQPIRNADGLYSLVRDGKPTVTLRNTIVHELFHAIMDDYNRTGMAGGTNLQDIQTKDGKHFLTKEAANRYATVHYPNWFIEGTASAVENNYQFRYNTFQALRRLKGTDGNYATGELNKEFTSQLLVDNYLYGFYPNGKFMYFNLDFDDGGTDSNGNEINIEVPRYVSGYLATLYLSELSARYAYGQSTVQTVNGVTTVDSNKLRGGLDSLLKWMHEGSTLDSLIEALSPKDEQTQQPIYKDTKSFQDLFIKGEKDGESYKGDGESQAFVVDLLNYFLYLDNQLPEDEHPNGSILFDFSERFSAPLDMDKESSSEYLKITNSNTLVPSTVKNDTPYIGGGKSNPDQAPAQVQATADEEAQEDAQENQEEELEEQAPQIAAAEPETEVEPEPEAEPEPTDEPTEETTEETLDLAA